MAKKKTPKAKKQEQQKVDPQKAREEFMSRLAEDVKKLRAEILKENKEMAPKLDLYALLYKNLLLEHYKTMNTNYNDEPEEGKKETPILDKDGNPVK